MMGLRKVKNATADAASAAVETGVEAIADNLPALAELARDAGLEVLPLCLPMEPSAQSLQGVFGFIMAYKLNRTERYVALLIGELAQKMDIVNRRLDALEAPEQGKFIGGKYRDAFLDSIVDEIEEDKVRISVNAFLNLMGEPNVGDSQVLTLFDDLTRLSSLDLRVLRLYGNPCFIGYDSHDDLETLMAQEHVDESQYRAIREKLCRFGLLKSMNEEKREDNLESVQKCLTELIKQLSSPKSAKLPKAPKTQKLGSSDSYKISSLGNRYLRLMRPVAADNG